MEAATIAGILRKIDRGAFPAGPTNGHLLGRFVDHRDDQAFALLVRRHGPMVWGVCRRRLDRPDAEDAFQATFLVLVRKAASVVPRERVGHWLHGVARRTALLASRTAARRRERERPAAGLPEPAAPADAVGDDLGPVLDGELTRLPDRYRAVLVLCDLEGHSRREAARHLGVPEGSVSGWLSRGRAMLAKRLARRGVTLPAGVLATAVACPPSVMGSTIAAANVCTATSVEVAFLMKGVLNAMMVSKLKLASAVLIAVAGLGGVPAPGGRPTVGRREQGCAGQARSRP